MHSLRAATLLIGAALALTVGACGSDGDDATPAPAPRPAAQAEDFPAAGNATLQELRGNMSNGPVLAPSVSVLDKGTNRFAFALFDRARKQLAGAAVALYVSRTDGTGVRGPFLARSESLEVKPQFQSRQTATDPDAAKTVYVADVPFAARGQMAILALVRLDGRIVATDPQAVQVGRRGAGPPEVGARATRINTPTVTDVGGNLEEIDTRIPPLRSMHEVDFADVLGKKPVVLLFATPQLCQSRVCGPVVDVAAEVQSKVGDGVAFVHMEIYRDNDVSKGFRPQVGRYRLPTEPWAFIVGRDGRVAERLEGAFSTGELERAVAKVRT